MDFILNSFSFVIEVVVVHIRNDIQHKNNTTQLYFIQGAAELHWNFSTVTYDNSDIHKFPTMHMAVLKSVKI